MAAMGNPFRRKQDAILGVDVSNQHSRPSSQASFGLQDTVGGKTVRNVGAIPAHITHFQQIPEHCALTPDPEAKSEQEVPDINDIRREIESVYNGTDYHEPYALSPASEPRNPFGLEDEDEEDEEEDDDEYDSLEDDMSMYAGSMMTKRRPHRSKRVAELTEGYNISRSPSATGFRSNSTDSSMSLPSKAERMLGMATRRSHSTALAPAPRVHKSKKGGLAPKAQRLLGVRSDTVQKSQRLQEEKGSTQSSTTSGGMTMEKTGVDLDDFKRMLMIGKGRGCYRRANTDSVSDASSLSRSSMLDSQTSRSSRELLSPDADTPTWTSPNSAPPPWLGLHPAFRKKPSVDSEGFGSPISPNTVLGAGSPNVPLFVNVRSINGALSHPVGAFELDAGPVGPPSPVELPVPESDLIARSLPNNAQELSSLPPSPKSRRPSTAGNKLGAQRSSSSLLVNVLTDRPASADDATTAAQATRPRQQRPSAIFDNPNIFEMPGDMPDMSTPSATARPKMLTTNSFPAPPSSPPLTGRSVLGKLNQVGRGTSSPPHQQSPYAPPQRPLPPVPQQRSTSGGIQSTVNFDAGRTRQQSEDTLLSPTSTDEKSLRSQPSLSDAKSTKSAHEDAPPLTAMSVPSPLAMAAAEGRPITKEAPPPLRSPDEYPLSSRQLAAQAEKKRVELIDQKSSAKPNTPKKEQEDDNESAHRPFSWQSTKSRKSMHVESEAPPMPPALALKIPNDAIRRAASHSGVGHRSGALSATPLTATSARSRASRLEKALESALSKDGMDKALSGEKIEDLFRSAGAEELFLDVTPESRELIGLNPDEDSEEARQAHHRAQDLLKDLSELQSEVDQLRKLYAHGGPLEGIDLNKLGAGTI